MRATLAYLNISTLANTLLAFVVMTFVSPLVYVIVFFGALPFLNLLMKRSTVPDSHRGAAVSFTVFASAIGVGMLVSAAPLQASLTGVGTAVISAAFAASYMSRSEVFHCNTGLTASELLSVRFFFVVIACGGYSLLDLTTLQLAGNNLFLLVSTAITGSIIPLFLPGENGCLLIRIIMQGSIFQFT